MSMSVRVEQEPQEPQCITFEELEVERDMFGYVMGVEGEEGFIEQTELVL